MVTWRPVSTADDAAVTLLTEYFDSRAQTFPGGPGGYHVVFPRASDFAHPHGVFLVVEDRDDAGRVVDVGCGGIRRIAPSETGAVRFEVKHLWLQPGTRRRGYGRLLLEQLEARAHDLGAAELVLDTNDSLAAAGGLYRSSGFEMIAPYNNNPNATTWYRKRLAR